MPPALPLAGLRVLTFENFGAGPFGSMYLADLGAEVIKIENREQGGDATRAMGPFFLGEHDSQFFQAFNLNKKSVTLNLKHPAGREAFHRLVPTADVVLNNLRGDQPGKLGLDYAALGPIHPRVICAHLSAYGRDNERKGWPGYDYLMQAEAGYLHLSGEPGSPPARMGLSIVDYMTGITTAVAILSSLIGVLKGGRGHDIDVSLFDVALHQLTYPGAWYLNSGYRTERLPRSAHPSAVPVQLQRTRDGWIFIMCMTQKFWSELVAVIERPDLASHAGLCHGRGAPREPRDTDSRARRGVRRRDYRTVVAQAARRAAGGAGLRPAAGAGQPVLAPDRHGARAAAPGAGRLSRAGQPDQARWREAAEPACAAARRTYGRGPA